MHSVHLAVLMTSHDHRARTLSALRALEGQLGLPAGTTLGVHLVDTGSTDGTPEAVRLRHPAVEVMSVGPDVSRNQALRIASRNSRSG
ncbi:glucosyl transferase, partial [Streptomyces sp. HCCB10043]